MSELDLLLPPELPLTMANGYGVDSWAYLIGLTKSGFFKRRKAPVLITFADVGAEKQETYDRIPDLDAWLKQEAGVETTTVRYVPKNFKHWPPYYSLEDNCLTNGTLPGIAFGPKSCSIKWKQAPQHAFMKEWPSAKEVWARGEQLVKMIGYDASPADRRRTYAEDDQAKSKYRYIYPLQIMNWDRQRCMEEIRSVGLKVPPKSSCFFCTAMKPWEVDELAETEPDKLIRIIQMEARATPRIRNEGHGLWRGGVKGTRGGIKKPGRMTDYIREKGYIAGQEIDEIWASTPTEMVDFQKGFAAAAATGNVQEFLKAQSTKDYRHILH